MTHNPKLRYLGQEYPEQNTETQPRVKLTVIKPSETCRDQQHIAIWLYKMTSAFFISRPSRLSW